MSQVNFHACYRPKWLPVIRGRESAPRMGDIIFRHLSEAKKPEIFYGELSYFTIYG
jgi:hypothetical protein